MIEAKNGIFRNQAQTLILNKPLGFEKPHFFTIAEVIVANLFLFPNSFS